MSAYGCIYLLTSPSGKHYVGQTIEDFESYFHTQYVVRKGSCRTALFNAINKYGIENFTKQVIITCMTKESLDQAEIDSIKEYNSIENGYNIREGGSHGKHAPTSKVFSEEYRQNMSEMMKGRVFTEEHKLKISNTLKNNKIVIEQITKLGKSNSGKVISEEQRLQISNTLKGNQNAFGNKWTEEAKTAFSKKKEVYNYIIKDPDGKEHHCSNLKKFCRENNLPKSNLVMGKYKGWILLSKIMLDKGEVV